jgi:predicted nucleotidyltransferase
MQNDNEALSRFRAGLNQLYGDRLTRVILFGSRARGDARADSDYDLAVFLNPMTDRWQELDRLSNLTLEIIDETGALINALPYPSTAYDECTPLMAEIRQEGIDL